METGKIRIRERFRARLVICSVLVLALTGGAMVHGKTVAEKLPPPVDSARVLASRESVLFDKPLFYCWLVPGPLVFIALLVSAAGKPKNASRSAMMGLLLVAGFVAFVSAKSGSGADGKQSAQRAGIDAASASSDDRILDRALALYDKGRFAEARRVFESFAVSGYEFPALLHNIALCRVREGDFPAAIDACYRGLSRSPDDPHLRTLLGIIERGHGLGHQYSPVPFIAPDLPIVTALVSFNSFFIVLGLFLRAKKRIFFLAAVFSGFVFVAAGTFGAFLALRSAEPFAVAGVRGAPVRRIPDDSFPKGEKLAPGSVVRVIGKAGTYLLVETGTGARWWIAADDIVSARET